MKTTNANTSNRLAEVVILFLRLGITAFGGPAAHIGMYYDEAVIRRKWLTEQEFLDLLGAVNLIPGPNSTEMAIHLGRLRAGWRGLVLAGVCFILPAMVIVMALAWAYTRFGSVMQVEWLLYGVKPVVVVIVIQALIALGKKAVRGSLTLAAGFLALGLYAINVSPIAALIIAGILVMAIENRHRIFSGLAAGGLVLPLAGLSFQTAGPAPFTLSTLFFVFLKIGSVLYGSGYVLLAFLHSDFVVRLGWLSDQQLLDAIAIGQVTPGPVFTTATFIGYILGGIPGAVLSTIGIFLPSFIFVALSYKVIPRLRSSPWAAGMLDGVNVASLGLMAAVTWEIGRASIIDFPSLIIAVIAAVLLFRYKVNTTWLILGSAAIGFLIFLLS